MGLKHHSLHSTHLGFEMIAPHAATPCQKQVCETRTWRMAYGITVSLDESTSESIRVRQCRLRDQ